MLHYAYLSKIKEYNRRVQDEVQQDLSKEMKKSIFQEVKHEVFDETTPEIAGDLKEAMQEIDIEPRKQIV